MTDLAAQKRPLALAITLVAGGVIGFIAAFALTLDKFQALEHPSQALSCDFSFIVQCGKNLSSAQGSAFGFPNPVIGLAGFFAVIVVGMALFAGARFDRWFWIVFNLGLTFAIGFVIWLISQSIFVLGTLCPWCMVVWVVTIPLFLSVTLRNLSTGVLPSSERARRFFTAAQSWVPLASLICYLIVALIAQVHLNFLAIL
ncbi:MAG: hypothetical protein QOF79_1831 [Actinomycetota bacterium]|nr:hypothetical protein [Actinomycetota bacterium]